MNFYISIEPCRRLKNLFSNLSSFYIVDVDTILDSCSLDITKPAHQYLINTELKRLILAGIRSKRYQGIIYINKLVDSATIESIRKMISDSQNSNIDELVILDDYDVPKLKPLYKNFDEVIFFPTLKKSKIVECTTKIPK